MGGPGWVAASAPSGGSGFPTFSSTRRRPSPGGGDPPRDRAGGRTRGDESAFAGRAGLPSADDHVARRDLQSSPRHGPRRRRVPSRPAADRARRSGRRHRGAPGGRPTSGALGRRRPGRARGRGAGDVAVAVPGLRTRGPGARGGMDRGRAGSGRAPGVHGRRAWRGWSRVRHRAAVPAARLALAGPALPGRAAEPAAAGAGAPGAHPGAGRAARRARGGRRGAARPVHRARGASVVRARLEHLAARPDPPLHRRPARPATPARRLQPARADPAGGRGATRPRRGAARCDGARWRACPPIPRITRACNSTMCSGTASGRTRSAAPKPSAWASRTTARSWSNWRWAELGRKSAQALSCAPRSPSWRTTTGAYCNSTIAASS